MPCQTISFLTEEIRYKKVLSDSSNSEFLTINEEHVVCVLNLHRGDIEVTESVGYVWDGLEYLQILRHWRRRWVDHKTNCSPPNLSMGSKSSNPWWILRELSTLTIASSQ